MATFTAPRTALRDSSDLADVATQSTTDDHERPLGVTARPWFRRGSLLLLLAATACLYLIGLSASGYGNSFYAAAAQAGSESWKAMFFGSLDAGNAITVDKPPLSLWLMALSVRIFGLSSWSVMAPQALLGVATVGVVFASVRRTAGHWPALLAGAVLALTPVATLMFRFDNPDAMLLFLLSLATYFVLRATERASARSLVLAGILVGLGFLTKMMQAFLVLPAFALVYLIAAPTTIKKRLLHLVAAFGAMVVAFGWWVAIVELVPASWRPYVGGSTDDSIVNLILSYNGLGRILGQSAGNGGGGASFGSTAGIARLFEGVSGGMVAWLVPAALIMTGFALVALRARPRTDLTRAALIIWSGSLVVTGLTFSFMAGTYHDYYTVALAAGIAGSVAVGSAVLWRARQTWLARVGLAFAFAATTVTAVVLLGEATGVYADLRWVVGIAGALATVGVLIMDRLPQAVAGAVIAFALVAGLTGPTAYAIDTASTAHTGSIVTAGPVQSTGMGGGGRGGFGGGQGGPPSQTGQTPTQNGQTPTQNGPTGQTGQAPTQGGGTGGGMGSGTADSELVTLLSTDAGSYTWVAATTGSQTAATYQLATESPVMAIGGCNGGDDAPTLAEFEQYVASGRIHYYIASGNGGGGMGRDGGSASEISTWVSENFTATTVGNTTVYDLTQGS